MASHSVKNGETAGVRQQGLRKGPWTAAEDAILVKYVQRHGEGNWNSVQKNSGLMRCGKSCRLRWANHLRPNLKKSSFTPEEEDIIVELHSKMGNKWARMASQLPGRTDNEIKNFWNTRLKRRQRAGLPVYPQEFQESNAVQFYQQQNSSPPSSFSSLKPAVYNPCIGLLDTVNCLPLLNPLTGSPTPSFHYNPCQAFHLFGHRNNFGNGGLFALSYSSPVSLQSLPSATLFCQNQPDFDNRLSLPSQVMAPHIEPTGFVLGLDSGLPSDQIPTHVTTENRDHDLDSDDEKPLQEKRRDWNSGLLDTLLQEAKILCSRGKVKEEEEVDHEAANSAKSSWKAACHAYYCKDEHGGLSSSQSSIGMKPYEEAAEEMNSMEDHDLLGLFHHFPASSDLLPFSHT